MTKSTNCICKFPIVCVCKGEREREREREKINVGVYEFVCAQKCERVM